jgi:HD-GYP domain-containing protein (c-di-GMP phosphodiesterase class II)
MDAATEIKQLKDKIAELEATVLDNKEHIKTLHIIGTALSSENDLDVLLEMILSEARSFTNADAGTLYMMSRDENSLDFNVVQTASLDIFMGGKDEKINWPALPLYKEDGSKNSDNVAAHCALTGEIINIHDVYDEQDGYDFSGPKKFDETHDYKTKSMLVIPMKNHEDEVIGVCQLINALDKENSEPIEFGKEFEQSTLSLASQAAIAISNVQLINDLRELLEAFIKSIASAIDAKSPYTGGHVRKVAEISMLIANELNDVDYGHYQDVDYNYDQLNEIRISALMHDVGKITTPEYVVDKSTKLETIYDRIETVLTRFEVLKRDKHIAFLEGDMSDESYKNYEAELAQIDDDIAFIKESNIGGEFMSDDKIERIEKIAKQQWNDKGETKPMLTEDEVYNLTIRKGTLTEEEREQINFHATMSNTMLEALPFPKKLARVPEIAGGHHEKLNGKGYPKGLDASQLTLEARILAIADIFEALTASDRPYKDAKKMSEVIKILGFMVKDGELDPDLLKFFYDQDLHIRYAKAELKPEQLDI